MLEMTKPKNILKQGITKEKIKSEAKALKNALDDGLIDAVDALRYIKFLEEAAKEMKNEVWDGCVDEMSKIKETEREGTLLKYKSGGGKWSYKGIPEWEKKKAELDEIQKQAQLRSKMKGVSVDPDTGEVLKPAIYYSNKDTVEIKIK